MRVFADCVVRCRRVMVGVGGGCYVEGAVVTCRAEIMGENGGRDSGEERKRKRRDTE